MKKIKCKTCFWRRKSEYDGKDYCYLIVDKTGRNIEANRTECDFYLKKGTEPKWLCSICGKNTFGETSISENGKQYCSDCYWKEKEKERKRERAKKIKKLKELVGKEKAEEIIKLFNL